MSKTPFSWLKKLSVLTVMVISLVAPTAQALNVAPNIVVSGVSPNPFDPINDNVVIIDYMLQNSDGAVHIEILRNNIVISNLLYPTLKTMNTPDDTNWDGKFDSNNQYVPATDANNNYKYRITAENLYGTDVEEGPITVVYNQNQDTTAPVISLVTPVPTPTSDTTPNFTFNTNEAGTILYGGSCTSSMTSASVGNNVITLSALANGTYNDCTVKVKDAANNISNTLLLPSFTIQSGGGNDNTPPVISLVTPVPTPTADTTPNFTFSTNEAGTILYGGSCTSSMTSASVGNNVITLSAMNSGTYSDCTVKVKDAANNISNTLLLPPFTIQGGNNGCIANITGDYVTKDVFNPDDNETTTVKFDTDKTSDILVEILDGNTLVRELADQNNVAAGTHSYSWDGEDEDGDVVSDDVYTYRIKTYVTGCGTDTETGDVEVDTDGGSNGGDDDDDFDDNIGDLIDDVYLEDAVFDPTENERARMNFDVLEDNVDIDVEVIRFRNVQNHVIREIIENDQYDESNNNDAYWNGKDDDNDIVDDDVYVIHIHAEKNGEEEDAYRYTEVDTDGILIGFPGDDDNYCAGYTDVPADNPYCKAIMLMKLKGIFTGYPNGTFGLYNPITRAETTKVVVLAIGHSLLNDDGTNLGFWDVIKGAWYMKFLRTAKAHGIINGYPSGDFRPGNTPNKVELLKIFLEGTGINIPHCNVAPFVDTPVNFETRWYIDYVCFAANHGLAYGDGAGHFNPAGLMNRGDVAMLFYNFYVQGMDQQINLGYTPANNYNNYYYYEQPYTYTYSY